MLAGPRMLVGHLTLAGHRVLVGRLTLADLVEVADGRAGPAEAVDGPEAIVVDDLKR